MPDYPQFAPQYIQLEELGQFGLPTPDVQSDVMTLVEMASLIIDEDCGRIDGDGNGSLVVTTWVHRCLVPASRSNRNMVECPMKPLMVVDTDMVASLQSAAVSGTNRTYTGVLANTITSVITGTLSPIIGCSGRFGYGREDQAISGYDMFTLFPTLQTLSMMGGGPPLWTPVDVSTIDYDPRTGEMWLPLGLNRRFAEVMLVYNAGFNPRTIPRGVKHVTAALVKNAMASGDGTTFLMGLTVAKSGTNVQFGKSLLDPTLRAMLTPYRNVRGA